MSNQRILAIGPNGGFTTYTNASALSRALSGNGTESRRNTISRRLATGGGYVGNVYVQRTSFRADA